MVPGCLTPGLGLRPQLARASCYVHEFVTRTSYPSLSHRAWAENEDGDRGYVSLSLVSLYFSRGITLLSGLPDIQFKRALPPPPSFVINTLSNQKKNGTMKLV